MEVRIEPRLLKGFRDFLPGEEAGRVAMLSRITRAFALCGFAPLSTPAIEYADILLGKYGVEGEKLLYRFQDNGGRDVALRYDLTVPLARVAAQYRDLAKPFKRYQVGTVWRAEKPAHGRFREFIQCDADIVGTASPLADADCIAAGILALEALGLDRFEVRIGHRAVLNQVLARAGIEDPSAKVEALRAIDKLDKAGADAVRDLLASVQGIGADRGALLLQILERTDLDNDPTGSGEDDGRSHLATVLKALDSMGLGRRVRVDLRIARGLDYYTGTVYETILLDLPSVGSVMSGGRYDGLLEMYGVPAIPSVGISIGVDRLFAALCELGQAPQGAAGPRAVVCVLGDGALDASLALLSLLRRAGIPAECSPDTSARLKKQIEYASRRGAAFAILIGEDEVAAREATLKDLATGEQHRVPWDEVAGRIALANEVPQW